MSNVLLTYLQDQIGNPGALREASKEQPSQPLEKADQIVGVSARDPLPPPWLCVSFLRISQSPHTKPSQLSAGSLYTWPNVAFDLGDRQIIKMQRVVETQEEKSKGKHPEWLLGLVFSLILCFVLCKPCLDTYVSLKHSDNKIAVTLQTAFPPTNQT